MFRRLSLIRGVAPLAALVAILLIGSQVAAHGASQRRHSITGPRTGHAHAATPRHRAAGSDRIVRYAAGNGIIVEDGQAPFPAMVYTILNHWYKEVRGQVTIVYAGVERQDPLQGVVIIERASSDYTTVSDPIVLRTPRRFGAVRVVGAVGDRLVLASASGAQATVDVAANSFV